LFAAVVELGHVIWVTHPISVLSKAIFHWANPCFKARAIAQPTMCTHN